MTRTLSVWVGASIIYLYGTVNGEAATFTLVGDGEWQAVVPRAEDDNYILHLEAYSANGLEGTYDYTLYYGFMPCIIDRTPEDVSRVKALAAKGWANMTPSEQAEWTAGMKGAYNATDLNRVNHNISYLAGLLDEYGYEISIKGFTPVLAQVFTDGETGETWTIPYHSEWIESDIPTEETAGEYLADVQALKDAFYGTQIIPESMNNLGYADANNIEKLLLEIETYINRMVAGFRKCGTFKSGQGVILP